MVNLEIEARVKAPPHISRQEAWKVTVEAVDLFRQHLPQTNPPEISVNGNDPPEEMELTLPEQASLWLRERQPLDADALTLEEDVFTGFIIGEEGFRLDP